MPEEISHQWKRYLEYDSISEKNKTLYDISDVLGINKNVKTLYFDGSFRDLIDVENLDLKKSLQFSLKINMLFSLQPVKIKELAASIVEEWERRDYDILKHENAMTDCYLVLYVNCARQLELGFRA